MVAEQEGFKTAIRSAYQLHVGDSGRIDFTLEVGQVTQSTQVTAGTPLLATENTAVGTVIENRRIVELPLNGRNYYQLIALSPNVTAEMGGPGFALGRQGGDRTQTVFSVAGQHLEFNRFMLDGAENTDVNWNTFMIRPSVEALQEFKVQTGIYSVEFGRAVTQISVITKPGGNQFHGTAFEFLRNSNLDAKEFLNTGRKNPFRRNQFGYVASGRIIKDKLFFMSNIEWTRDRQTFLQKATVPTAEMRTGDFSGYSKVLYDPNTRVYGTDAAGNVKALSASPFTNNTIPTGRFDVVSLRMLKYYPGPTQSGTANNYLRDSGRPINYATYTNRLDYNESDKSNWFGRYSFSDELYGGTSIFPNQQTNTTTKVYQIMISNTRTFGTTVVNEARFCYGFFHSEDASVNAYTNNVMGDIGMAGSLDLGPSTWRVPAVGMQSFNGFGDGSGGPFINKNNVFQWMDNLSIVRGRHSLKFGGEVRRDRFNQSGNSYLAPYLTFSTTFTRDPNNLSNTGLSFGDFLLGHLTSAGRAMASANRHYRSTGMFGYAEDVWALRPGLTMTLGIRYENVRPWTDKYQAQMNLYFPKATGIYDPTNVPILTRPGSGEFYRGASVRYADNIPVQVGDQYMGPGGILPDNDNFAPRVGLAWTPTNKWSIRVGAGFFYSQDIGNASWDIGRNIAGRQDVFANAEKPNAPVAGPWAATSTSSACSNYNGPSGTCVSLPVMYASYYDRRTPYTFQYILNVQRQLTENLGLELAYMGNEGHKLGRLININVANYRTGPNDTRTAQQRRTWSVYGPQQEAGNLVNSNYNALSAKLTRRFSQGLTFLTGFTYGKSIDTGASGIRAGAGDGGWVANPFCLNCDRGLSQFDMRKRFVTSMIYEIPGPFRGKNSIGNRIVGGWQVSTILTLADGTPYGAGSIGDRQQVGGSSMADATGISPFPDNPTVNKFWNIEAFNTTNPDLLYRAGNVGRNVLRTPGVKNWDASLMKDFQIREGHSLQFRWESFNLPNHPNWNSPSTDITNPAAFGKITSARSMRSMQFGLKYRF